MHTHPILAAACLYAWAAFAAALLTSVLGALHRDAKLAQRGAEGGEDQNHIGADMDHDAARHPEVSVTLPANGSVI